MTTSYDGNDFFKKVSLGACAQWVICSEKMQKMVKMIVVKWQLENEVSSLVWRIDGARAMKWCISNSAITDFLSDGVFGKDIGRWMSECC